MKKDADRRRLAVVFALTVARLPLAAVFAILFRVLGGGPLRLALGLSLLLMIELADLLDGVLARRMRVVTEWGAMLDPYMDSLSRLVVFWTLARAGLIMPVVPLVMALRDITVAYCRIALARAGGTVAARWSGKIKAVVQGAAAILIVAGPIYQSLAGDWTNVAISWIVIAVTLASAVEYVRAAARALAAPR